MTRQQDPVLDAQLSGITFTEAQANFLHHHLANGSASLIAVRDICEIDDNARRYVDASIRRIRAVLEAINTNVVGNHAERNDG